jgi:hypothetical protein
LLLLVAQREPEELEELAPPEEEDDEDEEDEEDPPDELEELMPGCWLLFTPGLAPGAMGAVGADGAPGAAVEPGDPEPWPPADCALANSMVVPMPTPSMAPIAMAVVSFEARMMVP